ncbi:MAG: protein kinase [Planctomycetota bacterium]
MTEERRLAEAAIESDLLGDLVGPAGLTEPTPVPPDKYELKRRLGSGGAGVVYLAEDKSLGRPVAIKFLHDASGSVVERFRREARFTARLNDPSIVQIYETGEHHGSPFIVMQYVEGVNLADAELDPLQATRVVLQVATALDHAHKTGIVHRDIKPENILIDQSGHAYVTDFGIARDMKREMGNTISLQGQIMGTPALMPPEQARGDQHAVDERSDIYALGATLYTKLTGRQPYEADNIVDLLHKVIHEDPPFPRAFRADIPRDLESVVLRCMKKRRADRYQSTRELIEELEKVLEGGATAARTSAWFRTLVTGGGAEPPEPERDSVTDDSDLTAALETAREISAWDAELYRVSRDLPRLFPKLDRIVTRLDTILEQRPGNAWARFYRGSVLFRRGELADAVDEMERAIDRTPDRANAFFELGRVHLALYLRDHATARKHISRIGVDMHLDEARERLEQAGRAFGEARRLGAELPPWQSGYADAVRALAWGDPESCIASCEKVLAEDPDAEEVWKLRGDALRLVGRPAIESYQRALEVRRSYFDAALALAETQLDANDDAGARAALERALTIHPGHASATTLLARTHLAGGLAEKKKRLASGVALAREARAADPAHFEAAITLAELLFARAEDDDGLEFEEAFQTLADARTLSGCLNRVDWTEAQARLARARFCAERSRNPAPDLERVFQLLDEAPARADSEPWQKVRAEAERMSGSAG